MTNYSSFYFSTLCLNEVRIQLHNLLQLSDSSLSSIHFSLLSRLIVTLSSIICFVEHNYRGVYNSYIYF